MAKGFITNTNYKVEGDKAIVQVYGKLDNGESFLVENPYKPYFYIKETDQKKAEKLAPIEYQTSNFKNFNNEALTKVTLGNPKTTNEIRKLFSDNKIANYEVDIKFPSRFLIDHKILSTINIEGTPTKEQRVKNYYKNAKITPTKYFPELKVLSIDIETDKKAKELYSIALYGKNLKEVLIIKDKPVKNAKSFKESKSLLEEFKNIIIKYDPDIITGWYFIDFDLKFLKDEAIKHNIKLDIGRNEGDTRLYIRDSFFQESSAIVPGRVILDGINLLKINFVKLPDYKLATAAKAFTNDKKIFEGDSRYQQIDNAYKTDVQTFIAYNLLDAKLAFDILKNSTVLDLTIQRSLLTGIQLDGVKGSITSFDSLYLRELKKRKIAAPSGEYGDREERITGGYVRDSKPGIYDNIVVLDFKSLYPSIIRTFNIDPWAYVEDSKNYKKSELIEAPNKAHFKRENGILPNIIEHLWEQRDVAKKAKDPLASNAIKILMNSFFGVLANPICRFYSREISNAITHFGQHLIKLCADKAEVLGFEVIYGDTDSIFVKSNHTSYAESKKNAKELEQTLNNFFKKHIKKEYNLTSYLEIEFEKIFKKFFMPSVRGSTKGAKKRYAGLLEKDGKDELVFTGLESVRSDWTDLAKQFQYKLLLKLFKGEKIEQFIAKFCSELKDGNHDHLLIYKKSIRKPVEEYTKTTPPHIKAARKAGIKGVGKIEYIITAKGPEIVKEKNTRIDYDHYIEKQIKPIADSLLIFFNQDFDDILKSTKQSSLADF